MLIVCAAAPLLQFPRRQGPFARRLRSLMLHCFGLSFCFSLSLSLFELHRCNERIIVRRTVDRREGMTPTLLLLPHISHEPGHEAHSRCLPSFLRPLCHSTAPLFDVSFPSCEGKAFHFRSSPAPHRSGESGMVIYRCSSISSILCSLATAAFETIPEVKRSPLAPHGVVLRSCCSIVHRSSYSFMQGPFMHLDGAKDNGLPSRRFNQRFDDHTTMIK